MTSEASEPACNNCHQTQSQLSNPLKNCAKCKTQKYCSRECQKADWKSHKTSCSRLASDKPSNPTTSSSASSTNTAAGGPCSIPKPFTAIENCTWLHNRPEKDVFRLLVDIYRMRIEDEYKFGGDVDEGSLYGGAGPAEASRHFRRFLNKITKKDTKRTRKLLPEWWTQTKVDECVRFSMQDGFSNVGYAAEKDDIQDHYKQPLMPMQLRMFGERLDGTQTAGMSGKTMLAMQVAAEGGDMSDFKTEPQVGPWDSAYESPTLLAR